MKVSIDDGTGYFGITLMLALLAAWATHIIWTISTLSSETPATFGQMALAAIGAFMPPIGVVHGVMIWFGIGM